MLARPPLTPFACLRWGLIAPVMSKIRPRRVLEIGCGLGAFGSRIATSVDYVGVEADATSAALASDVIEKAGGRVVHGTVNDLDPLDSSFDLMCAFEVLEHQEDDLETLKSWLSPVAAGGYVLLSVPADPTHYGPWDELGGHYRRYTENQLRAVLEGAGLTDIQCQYYGWPLIYLTEPVRNILVRRKRTRMKGLSMDDRTTTSARKLQPKRWLVGVLIQGATTPFVYAQRLRPQVGLGLFAVARLPE